MTVKIYPESNRLKEIIESHRWILIDATLPKGKRSPYSWDELEKKGSVNQFEIGKNYIFAPIPKKEETLRQAYSLTKGLGPSLLVEDGTDESRWAGIEAVTDLFNKRKRFETLCPF